MTLSELEPRFVKLTTKTSWRHVDGVREADGIMFLCPACFAANGGDVGTHMILCWRPRVPRGVEPGPGRWELHGTGVVDLTLVGERSSSVLLTSGCRAHFFVEQGAIRGVG